FAVAIIHDTLYLKQSTYLFVPRFVNTRRSVQIKKPRFFRGFINNNENFYSKYSLIRSKNDFSLLPGWGLKFADPFNFSSTERSSGETAFGVHTFTYTSWSPL